MQGQIAQLVSSTAEADRDVVKAVFGEEFQTMGQWRQFLRGRLNDTVSAMLQAPGPRWSVQSFHALYIACWIHHPVEKGTFMLNLASLNPGRQKTVRDAYDKHCTSRKSSHLSGSGRSASKGWKFLNGYEELLVQYELTIGVPYLLLKAEGHTTGVSGIIPHLQSWNHKRKHGVGLEASPFLNALASTNPLLEARAAENYDKAYEKLLEKVLKLKGRMTTVREVVPVLFQKSGYSNRATGHYAGLTNRQLGAELTRYCDATTMVGAGGVRYRAGGAITGDMIQSLRDIAKSLNDDGDTQTERVYREIRLTPVDADHSLIAFCTSPGH